MSTSSRCAALPTCSMRHATARLATTSLCTMNARRAGSFSSTRPTHWPTPSSAGPCARWTCHRCGAVACAFASSPPWSSTMPTTTAVLGGTAVRAAMTTVPRGCPSPRQHSLYWVLPTLPPFLLSLSLSLSLFTHPPFFVSFSCRKKRVATKSLLASASTRSPLLSLFFVPNQTSADPRAIERA